MLYYFFVADGGTPETGLVAGSDIAWESLDTAENGTDKSGSAPSFREIGGGWYNFDITFGTAPWDVTGEDLVGVIDCDKDGEVGLHPVDRYKPVCITKRGLALARIAHKATQSKSSGDIDIYAADDSSKEMTLEMTDTAASLTRNPTAAG